MAKAILKSRQRAFAATLSFIMATISSTASSVSATKAVLQGAVRQNELIDNLERLGIKCIIKDGFDRKLIVREVRLGSSAYYKGLSEGDVIRRLKSTGIGFQLMIERDGKPYILSLKTVSATPNSNTIPPQTVNKIPNISSLPSKIVNAIQNSNTVTPKTFSTPPISSHLQSCQKLVVGGTAKEDSSSVKQEKELAQYDIELLIDKTGSMAEVDGTGALTKFQWCHNQIQSLERKLSPYKRTLTITTFNQRFNTRENCDPETVEQIYASIKPEGGTDLVDPLKVRCEACLERQKSNGRPQLIVIISDGLPNIPKDPKEVNRAIIEFSQRCAASGQIKIAFLQIGDTFEGQDFCLDLDENLTTEGAKFDMVNTKTFAQIKTRGMMECLVDAIRENAEHKTASSRQTSRFLQTLPDAKDSARAEVSLQQKVTERKQLETLLNQRGATKEAAGTNENKLIDVGSTNKDLGEFWTAYRQKNFKLAAELFENLVRLTRPDANAYYYAALSNQQINRQLRARQLYKFVVTSFPDSQQSRSAQKQLASVDSRALSANESSTTTATFRESVKLNQFTRLALTADQAASLLINKSQSDSAAIDVAAGCQHTSQMKLQILDGLELIPQEVKRSILGGGTRIVINADSRDMGPDLGFDAWGRFIPETNSIHMAEKVRGRVVVPWADRLILHEMGHAFDKGKSSSAQFLDMYESERGKLDSSDAHRLSYYTATRDSSIECFAQLFAIVCLEKSGRRKSSDDLLLSNKFERSLNIVRTMIWNGY